MPTQHLHTTKNVKTHRKQNLFRMMLLDSLHSHFFLKTTSSNIIQKRNLHVMCLPGLGVIHSYLQKLRKSNQKFHGQYTHLLIWSVLLGPSENILLVLQLNDSETIHTIFAF